MIKINKQNINQYKNYKYFVVIYSTINSFNFDIPLGYFSTNNPAVLLNDNYNNDIVYKKKEDNIKMAIHLSNSELVHSEINYWIELL